MQFNPAFFANDSTLLHEDSGRARRQSYHAARFNVEERRFSAA